MCLDQYTGDSDSKYLTVYGVNYRLCAVLGDNVTFLMTLPTDMTFENHITFPAVSL